MEETATRATILYTTKPLPLLVIFLLITLILASQIENPEHQEAPDIVDYLSEDTEVTNVFLELREDWTLSFEIIYVETKNNRDNITDIHILKEITALEGDDHYPGLNHEKGDRGKIDGIKFVFSIASMIKELNSSTPRFIRSLENEILGDFNDWIDLHDPYLDELGGYSIPDDQQTIDDHVETIPHNVLQKLVADTNGDDIWDSAVIILGLNEDFDAEMMLKTIENAIATRETKHTGMTQTGVVKGIHDLSESGKKETNYTIPLTLLFALLTIVLLFRNFKTLFITFSIVMLTLVWGLAMCSLLDISFSPIQGNSGTGACLTIVLIIGYPLYMVRRMNETGDSEEGIYHAVRKTLPSLFFGMLATLSVLWTFTQTDLIPAQVVGKVYTVFIISNFFVTAIVVPPLMVILPSSSGSWYELSIRENVRKITQQSWGPIVIGVLIISAISGSYLHRMNEVPEEMETESQGVESIEKLNEYQVKFNVGRTGIIIGRGNLNDTIFLEKIEEVQTDINDLTHVQAMSVVDIFKSVEFNISIAIFSDVSPIPLPIPIPPGVDRIYYRTNAWELIRMLPDDESRTRAIKIFYNSLTQELRELIINKEYTKTLMMIDISILSYSDTKELIDEINSITKDSSSPSCCDFSKIAGDGPALVELNNSIKDIQKDTLRLSLSLAVLLFMLCLRRIKLAVSAILTLISVVIFQALAMHIFGIELKLFISLVSALTIGFSANFIIMMSRRINEEGRSMSALTNSGEPVLEVSLVMIAGLLGGMAYIDYMRDFYALLIVLIGYSVLLTLLFFPSLLILFDRLEEKFGKTPVDGPS